MEVLVLQYKINKRKLALSVCLLLLFSTIFSFTTQGQLTYAVTGRANQMIAPVDNITRAEVAVVIERFLKTSKLID